MTAKTKNALFLGGAIILSGSAAYFLTPKILSRTEKKITAYDSLQNKTRKFITSTPEGKIIVGAGVFMGSMCLASGILASLSLYSKASGHFVSSLEIK